MSTRRRLLILSTAAVVVVAGAIAWLVSGDGTVREDVVASPTPAPTPVVGEVGAEGAFRCFIEGRRNRDIDMARPCMTDRYRSSITDPVQFIGASSPSLERATIVSSSVQDDRVVFDALVYWGRVEFVSEDTIVVVREGRRWLVDGWTQGTQSRVGDTTEVTLQFLKPGVTPRCEGDPPSSDSFVEVDRLVPTEAVVDDLALSVTRELFTGPWAHEGDAVRAFPPGSRVVSVHVDELNAAEVMLNDIALPPRPRCDYALWTLQETLMSLPGIEDVGAVRQPPSQTSGPDV